MHHDHETEALPLAEVMRRHKDEVDASVERRKRKKGRKQARSTG